MSKLATRIAAWANRHMPKHEDLAHNRWIGPFARRPELWRFTRRSVPRGVAMGLFVGFMVLIPGIQIVGAALMCVPGRGNIPLAVLMTFLSNPATTPFIIIGAIRLGNTLGYHADLSTFYALYQRGAGIGDWLNWLLSDAAPSLTVGLFVISVVAASAGYLIASVSWNWWVRHKRRNAVAERSAPE